MDSRMKVGLRAALAVTAGWASVMALAAIYHGLHLASRPTEVGYPFTSYLSTCFGFGSLAIYFVLSALLGYALRQRWSIALGMMLPWPLACAVEIHRDPTSHNLFPIEAVLTWLPAFLLAFLGASLGKKTRHTNQESEQACVGVSQRLIQHWLGV